MLKSRAHEDAAYVNIGDLNDKHTDKHERYRRPAGFAVYLQ
ncbi:hypothetical protein GGQ71_004565 [Rhizobium taibaishanense]|uniref:Uncharacterized protein n=1 Tax=Allorhizobium taibaishanense TaxID=887144 RepID=A0A7W6HRU2_9HYPH|nr:hypothetical protein [Allorhizobium taibaishanense]